MLSHTMLDLRSKAKHISETSWSCNHALWLVPALGLKKPDSFLVPAASFAAFAALFSCRDSAAFSLAASAGVN